MPRAGKCIANWAISNSSYSRANCDSKGGQSKVWASSVGEKPHEIVVMAQRKTVCKKNVFLLRVFLAVSFLAVVASLKSQTRATPGYQEKAAFLYNFARFINWPSTAFSSPRQTFDICVYGRDPFGAALEEKLLGKSVGDRRVALGRALQFQDLVGCHIIFVSYSEREPPADLVRRLKGRAVLLVGETEGFAASGGTIQFTIEAHRVRFLINPDAANRAGLKISSKLLSLAKIVRDGDTSLSGRALR